MRTTNRDTSPPRNEWLSVELRHLIALQRVAHDGSFRGAAECLGYVQSAVSQQIAFLERVLGTRLVERSRGPKPVTLTDAGRVVLSHVEEILAQLRAAEADIAALSEGRIATLRIGAFDEIAARVLPSLLRRFARRQPEIEVATVESSTDSRLLDLCRSGDLDCAFAELPVPSGPFAWQELLAEEYVLMVPAGSQLARSTGSPSLAELSGLDLVYQRGSRQAPRIEAQLRARGLSPRPVRGAESTATMQALVGASVGCAVVPRLAVDTADPSVALIDASRLVAPRSLGIVWHRERGARIALQAFVEMAAEVCNASLDETSSVVVVAVQDDAPA